MWAEEVTLLGPTVLNVRASIRPVHLGHWIESRGCFFGPGRAAPGAECVPPPFTRVGSAITVLFAGKASRAPWIVATAWNVILPSAASLAVKVYVKVKFVVRLPPRKGTLWVRMPTVSKYVLVVLLLSRTSTVSG